MKAIRIITLTAFCFTIISVVRAQEISRYLDDGGYTHKKNLIKIGFDPVNNEFPLIYERKLGKHFGAELGGGLVSLQRQYHMYPDNPYSIESTGFGYNGWIRIKIYPAFFPERKYAAFQTRINHMSGFWFTDILGNVGYQRVVVGSCAIDVNLGVGVRLYKRHDLAGQYFDDNHGDQLLITLTFASGYLF